MIATAAVTILSYHGILNLPEVHWGIKEKDVKLH